MKWKHIVVATVAALVALTGVAHATPGNTVAQGALAGISNAHVGITNSGFLSGKKPKKNPPAISSKEFTKLTPGMTYADAVAIIGSRGKVLSTVDMAGSQTTMYLWEGKSLGANANVMFQNDALVSKAQFGL
jgi:hypothetical protein